MLSTAAAPVCTLRFLHILANICHLIFGVTAILTGVGRSLIEVLICISRMRSGAEHQFTYLLAFHASSAEKLLLRSFAHF